MLVRASEMGVVVENESEEPKMKRAKQSENNEDRLSDLPDSILIHLMSFVPTKDAVRTCVLSTRWKDIWKCLPSLILHASHFGLKALFNKFVPKVLSFRDGSVPVHHFEFDYNGRVSPQLMTRVLRYAASHNVQQLKLSVNCDVQLLPYLFCQTLTSLDLSVFGGFNPLFPNSLHFTALTSLRLRNFAFGDSESVAPFSSCINLKTLVIKNCAIRDTQTLCISNATLVNLTIFAYQAYKIMLSTPNLCSFAFTGVIVHQISASNLSSIKEVNINAHEWSQSPNLHSANILISWLQLLATVRSLTLSSNALQVLSSVSSDLLNTEALCLGNLKSLKVKVYRPLYEKSRKALKSRKAEMEPSLAAIPVPVVNYLIRSSPCAKIIIAEGDLFI